VDSKSATGELENNAKFVIPSEARNLSLFTIEERCLGRHGDLGMTKYSTKVCG
jgi:hypothetical protein